MSDRDEPLEAGTPIHAVIYTDKHAIEVPMTDRDELTREKIPYDWARVVCPTCLAECDTRCRTLTTNRTTDAHISRILKGSRWWIKGGGDD